MQKLFIVKLDICKMALVNCSSYRRRKRKEKLKAGRDNDARIEKTFNDVKNMKKAAGIE